MLEQHQSEEAHHLGFRLVHAEQQAAEPDGLAAERLAGGDRIAAGGIAFVEDEIDHGHDRGEAFAALDGIGRPVGDAAFGDAGLGARDALLHRGFADEEGARDLLDREAGDDPQGQRDLLGLGDIRMAADEEEAEDVIAVVGGVDRVRNSALRIAEIGNRGFLGQGFELLALADAIDGGVASNHDEPAGGVARRTVLRPGAERAQAGILEGFLGGIEVAEIAQQGADRLGTGRREREVDPGEVGHGTKPFCGVPGWKIVSGRTS